MQRKKFTFILRIVLTPFNFCITDQSDTMKGCHNEPKDNVRSAHDQRQRQHISYLLADKPLSAVRRGSKLKGGLECEQGREKPCYLVSSFLINASDHHLLVVIMD